jgi:putative hemolysin
MFCIDVETSVEDARRLIIESGHSRVPVIGEKIDDVLGMLYSKDLLSALDPQLPRQPVLREIIRDPVYIPDTTGIPAVLELMQRQRVQIAIVTDEYGGVAGLVTMEDILEEIVGEIDDEYDKEEIDTEIQVVSPTITEVDGRVHIDDLNDRFGYQLPDDGEFDTIGGFVFSQLGRIPSEGEVLNWDQLTLTVLAADQRRINRLRIEKVGIVEG